MPLQATSAQALCIRSWKWVLMAKQLHNHFVQSGVKWCKWHCTGLWSSRLWKHFLNTRPQPYHKPLGWRHTQQKMPTLSLYVFGFWVVWVTGSPCNSHNSRCAVHTLACLHKSHSGPLWFRVHWTKTIELECLPTLAQCRFSPDI